MIQALRRRWLPLVAMMLVLAAPAARAQQEQEGRLSAEEKRAVQDALVWTGHYDGRVDGLFGPATRKAIEAFQRVEGFQPTGYLEQRQVDRLITERYRQTERFGWEIRRFPALGMDLGIPSLLFGEPESTEIGLRFRSKPDRPKSELVLYSARPMAADRFEALRSEVVDRSRFSRDVYDTAGDGWFVFSGRSAEGISQYTYIVNRDAGVRGFSFRYVDDAADDYAPLNVAMYNSLKVFEASGSQPEALPETATRAPEQPAPAPRGETRASGAGGVLVNGDGAVLTSAAAVEGCDAIRVNDRFDATLVAVDRDHALALVQIDQRRDGGYPHLGFRVPPVARDTRIRVVSREADRAGGTDADVGRGFVERVTGPDGDIGRFLIEADLNRGSTGAPVIDEQGRIAGLVEGRRGARVAAGGSDADRLPRDQGYAVNAYTAMAFLAAHGTAFGTDPGEGDDPAHAARRAAVGVACAD